MRNDINRFGEAELSGLAETFKLLGSVPRLKILSALTEGSKPASELAEAAGLSQSAASHQLKELKQMHIVKTQRDNRSIIYSLDDWHILNMLMAGFEHIGHTAEKEDEI